MICEGDWGARGRSLDFTTRKFCRANAPLLFDSTLNLRDKGKSSQNSAPETMRLRQPRDSSSAALTLSKLRFCESCLSDVCPPFRSGKSAVREESNFLAGAAVDVATRTITLCRRGCDRRCSSSAASIRSHFNVRGWWINFRSSNVLLRVASLLI